MADEKVILAGTITINTDDAVNGMKSAKAQLRDLKKQLSDMSEDDPLFDKLAKDAGELEDKIGDVNSRIKQIASDSKGIDTLIGGVEAAVGAFTLAQGAAALFGAENEDLEKTIVKVQGAMALLNGLQAVAKNLNKDSALMVGLHNTAQKLFGVQLTTNIGLLKLFTAALIGTGIGALAVVVGAVVTQWDRFNEKIKASLPALQPLADFFSNLDVIWGGVSNAIVEGLIGIGSIVAKLFSPSQWGEALTEAKGLGTRIGNAYSEGKQKAIEENEAEEWEKGAAARAELEEKRMAQERELAAKRLEELKKMDEEALKARAENLKRLQAGAGLIDGRGVGGGDNEDPTLTAEKNKTDLLISEYQKQNQANADRAKINKQIDDQETSDSQAALQARLALTSASLGLIHQLFTTFGKENSAAAKAVALASIAADTARAIAGAIAGAQGLPFPANLAAMATSIAAVTGAIAQATRILKAPTPNISANVPTTSLGRNAFQPVTPVNLQGREIDPLNGNGQRVYVLEDDIRKSTGRVNDNMQKGYVR